MVFDISSNDFITGNEKKIVTIWTIVHFIIGFIAFFCNIPLSYWFGIQVIFEIGENSKLGKQISEKISEFITNHVKIQAWAKYDGDSLENTVGDIFAGTLGWLLAEYLYKTLILK